MCRHFAVLARCVFEGLKAYKTKDGRTVAFRPDQNAKRLMDSAKWLEMPPVPEDMFMEAVDEVVRANKDYIPPFERRCLYQPVSWDQPGHRR